jgi:hypothetical protein
MVIANIDNKLADISLDKPFTVQAITATTNSKEGPPIMIDRLDKTALEQGATLVLQKPSLNTTADELKPITLNITKSR